MFYSNIRFEFAHKLRSLRFVFCFSSSCFRLVNNRPTIGEIIRIIRIIRVNGAFSLEKDIYKILDKFCRKFGNNLNIPEFDGLKWRRKKEGWVRFGPTFFFFFFISREMYTPYIPIRIKRNIFPFDPCLRSIQFILLIGDLYFRAAFL